MIQSATRYAGLFAGALLTIGVAAATPAAAQTATNLNCNSCVNKKEIDKDAVTSKALKDGNVKAKDLTAGAQPAMTTNTYINNSTVVSGDDDTVVLMPFELENKASLHVTATWQFDLNDNEGGDCAITLDSNAYSDTFSNGSFDGNVASGSYQHAASVTGVFPNVTPGAHAIRLVCRADTGDSINVTKRSVSVIVVPKVLPTGL